MVHGSVNMMFFRRYHHKLNESSDNLPQLLHCDVSSGSDTENSFDPCSYADDSFAQSPILTQLQTRSIKEYPSRIVANESKPRKFWKLGWAAQRAAAKRRKKALAELDMTIMQIRTNNSFDETSPSRSMRKKSSIGKTAIQEPYKYNESKPMPREVTWKRRVSSLEAFFKKECKSKYHYYGDSFNESTIMKIVPFEAIPGKSGTSFGCQDEKGRPKSSRNKSSRHNSTGSFEETVERGVSEILGKINSRSEEILDIVPDWSVASSSVDFMSAATTDDDETSISGYRQSPTQRSSSSGEDDDLFLSDGGCNSIESCTTISKDFETFMEEIMPRDLSMFSCYSESKRKKRRKKQKSL